MNPGPQKACFILDLDVIFLIHEILRLAKIENYIKNYIPVSLYYGWNIQYSYKL